MAVLYTLTVFNGAITGAATGDVAYSPAEMNESLARADKFFVTARVTQGAGTSPTLTVALEHSCDNVNWNSKAMPISAQPITIASVGFYQGFDLGTAVVGGGFLRVRVALGGTSPSANVQVVVCGRSSD